MAELVHFCHYEWLKQTGHFPADGNLQVAIRTPNLRKRPGGGAEGNDARRITIDPQPPPLAHDRLLNPRNGPAVPVRGGQDVNSPEKGIPADLSSDPAPTDDPPPPTSASSPPPPYRPHRLSPSPNTVIRLGTDRLVHILDKRHGPADLIRDWLTGLARERHHPGQPNQHYRFSFNHSFMSVSAARFIPFLSFRLIKLDPRKNPDFHPFRGQTQGCFVLPLVEMKACYTLLCFEKQCPGKRGEDRRIPRFFLIRSMPDVSHVPIPVSMTG